MPVDKQVLIRYQVLNNCFRNPFREYTIDDLVDECNKALCRKDKQESADYAVITINVKINKELESQLLSFGEDLEVLAPTDFRNHIAEKTKLMNQKYSDGRN